MKMLLLGVGMQGKAALHDLVLSEEVEHIIAADLDLEALKAYVSQQGYGDKVQCEYLDVTDENVLNTLMASGADVVLDLMPNVFMGKVAKAAVAHGVHLVNASYARPELKALADEAKEKGLIMLPEFGLDPGIDLVLLGEAVRGLDEVLEIRSYGAGVPELEAADNPLKYKISWTFEGVLKAYYRAGRIIRDGKVEDIGEDEMFLPENVHLVEIEGVGEMEAFPNGDALKYAEPLGLDIDQLTTLGRYTMRWPGHAVFWKKMVDLHLLDDDPVILDGVKIDRKRFLAAAMEPYLQYNEGERDLAILRVDVVGVKDGRPKRLVYDVIDRRDLVTGFTAMSRTVGFTVSIGAQWIASGKLNQAGLLSPEKDVPYKMLESELKKRGVEVKYYDFDL